MSLAAAIRTCELLGTASCFGRTVNRDKLDASKLRTARIRGFEIVARGESVAGQNRFTWPDLLKASASVSAPVQADG